MRRDHDHEADVFAALTGRFKHYCHEWDFMAIDETCSEFAVCTCSWPADVRKDVEAAKMAAAIDTGDI